MNDIRYVIREDGVRLAVGDIVCINQSFPKLICEFRLINGKLCAGFDYGMEGILYNQLHELRKA